MSPAVPRVLCSALGRTCRARPAAEELRLFHLFFSHILCSLAVPGVMVLQFFRFSVWKDLGVLWVQAGMSVLGKKGEARMSVQSVQWCAQLTPFVLCVLLPLAPGREMDWTDEIT